MKNNIRFINKFHVMSNMEQMMHVANNCIGYEPIYEGFQSSIGTKLSKSCSNCNNYKEGKCIKNLFDDVLTSLDQT
ncbi:hypothetical protein CLOACE_19860 [Clostridium acetireducens DSM 10703]|jgi:hypothetical protein|uniref:Uncharacterized protein n=1 Tax=Clostridium acetireducens DSM 10703 TaxID=1121290 RepID=A0A1E8EWH5_9CLOT|nr:hypothetical protein [Clostridium acetireducens]OFI04972.1 hypothetical protein CLOACE_19860 [Clostridium acetireducens DSM 10703]